MLCLHFSTSHWKSSRNMTSSLKTDNWLCTRTTSISQCDHSSSGGIQHPPWRLISNFKLARILPITSTSKHWFTFCAPWLNMRSSPTCHDGNCGPLKPKILYGIKILALISVHYNLKNQTSAVLWPQTITHTVVDRRDLTDANRLFQSSWSKLWQVYWFIWPNNCVGFYKTRYHQLSNQIMNNALGLSLVSSHSSSHTSSFRIRLMKWSYSRFF